MFLISNKKLGKAAKQKMTKIPNKKGFLQIYAFMVWMRVCHTPPWQQVMISRAVRAFGWIFWKK